MPRCASDRVRVAGSRGQWLWLGAPLVVVLSGCGAGPAVVTAGTDRSPIVVPSPPSATSPAAAVATAAAAGSPSGSVAGGVTDPGADLDIDDQVGDGDSVVVEAVDTSLAAVHVVIETPDGTVLGSDLRTAGRQPVTVRLDRPVPAPVELLGLLLADDGDGVLEPGVDRPVLDEEGEPVDEDFDYRVSGTSAGDD